jgi:hypothetical protein
MKDSELELEIVIKNLQTFSTVKKYDRMIVNNNNNYVTIDDRYGQSLRRWYNNDSRTDLIKPIKLTYKRAIKEYNIGNLSYKTILESINNLFNVCVFTYQDYAELHKLIMDLRAQLEVAQKKVNENGNKKLTIFTESSESSYCSSEIKNNGNETFDIESQENDVNIIEEIPKTFWQKCKSFMCKYIVNPIKSFLEKWF